MAEFINGNGSVVQSTAGYVQVAISSSTNASPIVITFGGSHNSNEGDTWQVEGHRVNTAANGTWQVHVVSASQLALLNSTGNGVGGATGHGVDYAVNPLLQVPDDADLANGASISTPVEGVFNTVPWLYQRVGGYRLYGVYNAFNTSQALTLTAWSSTAIGAPNTWTSCTNATSMLASAVVVVTGDLFDITFRTSASSAQDLGVVGLFGISIVDTVAATTSIVTSSATAVSSSAAAQQYPSPLILTACVFPVDGGYVASHNTANITIQAYFGDMTRNALMYNGAQLTVRHYRPNA